MRVHPHVRLVNAPNLRLLTVLALAGALVGAGGAALAIGDRAAAYTQDYCNGAWVTPGHECRATSYHSIIYNRGSGEQWAYNVCVYMITEAGNIRGGGAIVCDTGNGTARECVSSATPMSQGRTYPYGYADWFSSVENNTTYDSGCAV